MAVITSPVTIFARNFFPLLRRAIFLDVFCDNVGLQRNAGGRAGIGEFLGNHGVIGKIEAWSAVFLAHGGAEQAGLATGPPERPVNGAFGLEAVEIGQQGLCKDLPHRVAEHLMVLVEGDAGGGIEHGLSSGGDVR